jgi:hypothetical protein
MIPPPPLEALGLAVGDRVRWRERPGARWSEGRVVGRERDGSVGVRDDGRGASRALVAERLEVRVPGPRGGRQERAARTEQLSLWASPRQPYAVARDGRHR